MHANGEVIIVTGASRGIGAATARLAGARGYAVCVNYLTNSQEAEDVVASIRRYGVKAISVQADTSNASDVRRLFEAVDRELGPVNALVNNAGIPGGRNGIRELDVDTLRRVLDVNVVGYFLCAREAVRRMSTTSGGRGGAIVNVSSMAGISGGYRMTHYAASKAAVNGFTLGLAREMAGEGIRVNAVCPGVIVTDQHDLSDKDRVAQLNASIPLARTGLPEEVAETILWLLSDQSSYVIGALIPVSGGR